MLNLFFALAVCFLPGSDGFGRKKRLIWRLPSEQPANDACAFHKPPGIKTQEEAWAYIDAQSWGDDDNATLIALELARLGPEKALEALFHDDPFGVFHVESFSDYKCPAKKEKTDLDHLKEQLEHCFRERKSTSYHPFLWFEHISKGGGSSFCGRALAAMPGEVPITKTDEKTGKSWEIKNCEMSLPNQRTAPWPQDKSLLQDLFFQPQQDHWRIGENEFNYFAPQLWFLEKVPILSLTSIRFPADWVVSWFKSFKLGWLANDKNWLAQYNVSGEPGFVKGWLRVQNEKHPALADPAQDGNFQSQKFGGSRARQRFSFDPSQWMAEPDTAKLSVEGFASVLKALNRFNLVYVLDLSK
jgi:hypothetical protein